MAAHPETKDELADLPRLRDLYQSAAPLDPDEAAWTAALTRIRDGIPTERLRDKGPSRSRWSVVSLGAAAAVLAAVLLARSWRTPQPLPQPGPAEEPFPVVEADDVTIIRMDGATLPPW